MPVPRSTSAYDSARVGCLEPRHLRRRRFRSPGILPHPPPRPAERPPASCRALPGSMAPSRRQSRALPPRRSPTPAARRRHFRRQTTQRGELLEEVQIVDAGETIGANRDSRAGMMEAAIGGAPARVQDCCEGTSPASRRPRPVHQLGRRQMHAVDREQPLAHEAHLLEYSTGPQPGGRHDASHAPSSSSSARHAPCPCCRNSSSSLDSARWTLKACRAAGRANRLEAAGPRNTVHARRGSRGRCRCRQGPRSLLRLRERPRPDRLVKIQ